MLSVRTSPFKIPVGEPGESLGKPELDKVWQGDAPIENVVFGLVPQYQVAYLIQSKTSSLG